MLLMAATVLLVTIQAVDHRFPPWIPDDEPYRSTPAALSEEEQPPAAQPVDAEGTDRKEAWLEPELRSLAGMGLTEKGATVLAALAVIGITGLLIVMELSRRENRGSGPSLTVSDSERGTTTVDSESVRKLAEAAAAADGQVNRVRCRVRAKRPGAPQGPDRLVIICRPHLRMGASLEGARDNIQKAVRETVERSTGLAVDKVHILGAKFEPLPSGRMLEPPERRVDRA